jgi:hypothetical protein
VSLSALPWYRKLAVGREIADGTRRSVKAPGCFSEALLHLRSVCTHVGEIVTLPVDGHLIKARIVEIHGVASPKAERIQSVDHVDAAEVERRLADGAAEAPQGKRAKFPTEGRINASLSTK